MADRGGRGALVTGGSRGIGRAIVERLSSDGARVLFSYARDQTAAEAVVAAVAARGGIAQAVRADLAVLADITSLFEQAERWLSGLDVVVGNAGIGLGGRIAEITEATYDTVMNVNAKGTFFTLQEAARRATVAGSSPCLRSTPCYRCPATPSTRRARQPSSSSPRSPPASWAGERSR